MADEQKLPSIIWVHGMGDKPDHTRAPLGQGPQLELEASWTPLAEAAWLPLDQSAYQVAYWADLRKGVDRNERRDEPDAIFRRPKPEVLDVLSARERAAMSFAYVQSPVGDELNRPSQGASQVQQGRFVAKRTAKSARRGWFLLRAYLGRPHVLFYTALAGTLELLASMVNWMNIPRRLRLGRLMGFLLQDLHPYVKDEDGVRQAIIDRVIEELNKAYANNREICLIAQSMGTIVALDALYKWQEKNGSGKVQTFVTLACPLGIRRLRKYIWPNGVEAAMSFDGPIEPDPWKDLPFPVNVDHWFNLYDKWDYTTILDSDLADDIPEMRPDFEAEDDEPRFFHIPRIIDIPTRPNYNRDYMREPHDWYGFLSSPQLADIVCHFWLGATMRAEHAGPEEIEEPQPPEHLINLRRSGRRIGDEDEEGPPEPMERPTGETPEATAPVSRAGEHSDGEGGGTG